MGPNTATESPRSVTARAETSPCPTWNWIAAAGMAPAQVGRSVSAATRVAAPGHLVRHDAGARERPPPGPVQHPSRDDDSLCHETRRSRPAEQREQRQATE